MHRGKKGRASQLFDRRAIKLSVANRAGCAINFDLYVLYNKEPKIQLEVLSKSTVGREWDPMNSSVAEKFLIKNRAKNYRLYRDETFRLKMNHPTGELDMDRFLDRKDIVDFLIIVRGLGRRSDISVSMSNRMRYKRSPEMINLTEWSEMEEEE